MKTLSKNIFWGAVTLFVLAVTFSLLASVGQPGETISIDQLAVKIAAGEVKKIIVNGNDLAVELADGTTVTARKETELGLSQTLSNFGVDRAALQAVSLVIKDESGARFWLGVLIPTLLPILVIVGIFWFILRQAKTGANQAFSFGRSNIRLFGAFKDKISFKDVAGLNEAKQELEEVVDFLKNPKKFLNIGAKIPRGVLLMGPPGTGKTLLARAVAGESGVPFFHISASEFVEMFVGVGASRTRDSFATAKKSAPAILFIDEIDAVGRERGAGLGGGHDEREQTLNQILVEMDGFERDTQVIVLAASVTGDTPVLVKEENGARLMPIAEIIDRYYHSSDEEGERETPQLEVLGFEKKLTANPRLQRRTFFSHSSFKKVRSVFRHKVDAIYEIDYIGGQIRTTGNHSVFVRTKRGIEAKPVAELRPGEILVDIPYLANRTNRYQRQLRAHLFGADFNLSLSVYDPVFEEARESILPAYQYAVAMIGQESQTTIGRRFGLSQTTVSHWQRGVNGPRSLSERYFDRVLPRQVTVTPDLMRLFGYYVAEGYSRKELDFCFNRRETAFIADVKDILSRVFTVAPSRENFVTPNAVNIVYYSKPLAAFFARHCGQGAHHKHVPSFLYEAPYEYFIEFLRGVARGDGHQDKRGRLEITSVSRQLILELNWLCRMHGIKTSVNAFTVSAGRRINGGKPLPETKAWRLNFGASQNPFQETPSASHSSLKRAIVKRVTKRPFNDFVYDFCGCDNEAFFGGQSPVLLHNTNRPDILDQALLRPGRFDRRVILDLPDINDREAILKIHSANKPLDQEVNLKKVAVRTPGFSGADLANIFNEAAILTARQNRKSITQNDLYSSIEKVLLGPERRGRIISSREREITAYHEAGHALVAASLKDSDPVHKVSIVSRGLAGGYTLKLPLEEARLRTRSQFLTDLAMMMGGYAAEQEMFGEMSTGASNDLKQASELARRLVTQYGMSDALGPMTFGKTQELIFLGREIATEKNYSETVATQIDQEVKKFIARAYETAKKIIANRRRALQTIARALLEKEVLEQEEFNDLIKPFRLKPIAV